MKLILMVVAAAMMQGQAARVHVAPPPDARFPAEWYPPESAVAGTMAPVTGAPFRATVWLTTPIPMPDGRPPLESRIVTEMWRDAEGRTRTEEYAEGVGVGQAELGHQVEIWDPVRHCNFRWTEPGRGERLATAQCMSRRLSWAGDGMEAKMTRATVDVQESASETVRIEPMGEKTMLGLRVLGVRQVRTPKTAGGMASEMEIWWSPALHEIVLMRPLGSQQGLPTIEMKEVRPGEVDADLFYPPVGWRILTPARSKF